MGIQDKNNGNTERQESFFTHVQKFRADILAAVVKAESWPVVHQIFANFGLRLKPRGNGLAVTDSLGRVGLKASDLDRSLSKAKMEARFGFLQALERIRPAEKSAVNYAAEPLHRGPERDELYARFQAEIGQRRSALADIEQAYQIRLEEHRRQWQAQAEGLRRRPMLKKAKKTLRAEWRLEKESLARIRREAADKRKEIRQARPYRTWVDFLKFLAEQGQDSALTVLRSASASAQTSLGLAAVEQMRAVFRHPDSPFREYQEPKYAIDARGTIIFTLPGGNGTIRNSGSAIKFSPGSEKAKIMAGLLAQIRCGTAMELAGNSLKPKITPKPAPAKTTLEPAVPPTKAGGLSR